MRLIEFGQKEDFQPLARGAAFPQFYENGDRYTWWHPVQFSNRYWMYFVQWVDMEYGMRMPEDILIEALMMGGEL